jgi:hypothetical protein
MHAYQRRPKCSLVDGDTEAKIEGEDQAKIGSDRICFARTSRDIRRATSERKERDKQCAQPRRRNRASKARKNRSGA